MTRSFPAISERADAGYIHLTVSKNQSVEVNLFHVSGELFDSFVGLFMSDLWWQIARRVIVLAGLKIRVVRSK